MEIKPGLWKSTSSAAKLIMMFQTVIIVFLSFWIYEEYLNNTYLQAYVNGLFETDGWAFAIVVVFVLLLGVTTAFLRRNKSIEKKIEVASTQAKVSSPILTGASPKPASDLHPVVAALKAELAGLPVALGMPVPVASVPPRKQETPPTGAQAAVDSGVMGSHSIVPGSTRPETVIVGGMPVLKKAEQENKAGDKQPQQA